jgi:four helix bundle protein
MATFERFEDLDAWKEARALVKSVYRITSAGEFARDFALRDQIRRAAISVLSNISEGFERDGNKEFVQFLSLAKGSCGEIRAQLYIALDQAYLNDMQFQELSEHTFRVGRIIAGLMRYLNTSGIRGAKYK